MGPKKKSKPKKKIQEPKVIEMPSIFKKLEYTVRQAKKPIDNNHLLKEVNYRIELYNKEISDNINSGKKIEDDAFKENLFKNLISLKSQVDLTDDEYLKSVHIGKLWEFYERNLKFYYDVSYINKRTKKNEYEKLEDEDFNQKSNTYFASNSPLYFESEHRTEDGGILPPKDRLKEFKSKHVDNLKDQIIDHMKEKENDVDKEMFNNTMASGFNLRSTQYTTFPKNNIISQNSTGTKFFVPSKEQYKVDHINSLREIKSSYGYHRPIYNIDNLAIENKYLNEKNRELAEKRSLEEHIEYIDKWGRARSQYKTAVDNKYELIDRSEYAIKKMIEEKESKRDVLKSAFSAYSEKNNELK